MRNVGVYGTATNVAGQALVPIIVAAREKTLDLVAYNNPRGDLLDEPASIPVKAAAAA